MLSTNNLVKDVKVVPHTWIFEHYCKLREKLKGQDVMIRSPFNPKDNTPSFHIFWSTIKGKYLYHDFSTGNKGDAIDMIKAIHGVPFHMAAQLIVDDYNQYGLLHKSGYS